VTTDPRFCAACHTPIPLGSEVCANCGAYRYASSMETSRPSLQYDEPYQTPTGTGVDVALAAPGQSALYVPSAIATMPPKSPDTSGFAIASLVLGIVATILALGEFFVVSGQALEPHPRRQPGPRVAHGTLLLAARSARVHLWAAGKEQATAQRRANARYEAGLRWHGLGRH
jgi:hypothetical protein